MAKEKEPGKKEPNIFQPQDLSDPHLVIQAMQRALNIEAGLDRVRVRTMAMQKSEELSEVASVLFQQLTELRLEPMACAFGILDEQQFQPIFLRSWESISAEPVDPL